MLRLVGLFAPRGAQGKIRKRIDARVKAGRACRHVKKQSECPELCACLLSEFDHKYSMENTLADIK